MTFPCPVHGPEIRDAEFARIEALIAAGWGSVPQTRIPADWRQCPGPEKERQAA